MATHDWVVRKIAAHHLARGDDVFADHYPGFRKPPIFYGLRGAGYVPDVWVENEQHAYEVEPYDAAKHSISQLKAFARDSQIKTLTVVLCSGTQVGIERQRKILINRGLLDDVDGEIRLRNWRELFDEHGITRP